MKNDKLTTTSRMIASVFAATVLMVGVGSTYADTCLALCEDGTSQSTNQPDAGACESQCDTFCYPFWSNLKDCSYKNVNIKGDCTATCMDGTVFNDWSYTEAGCHSQCAGFCGTKDDVLRCEFKSGPIKGVPTVSAWGVAIMVILLLVGAKVYFNRRRAMQA